MSRMIAVSAAQRRRHAGQYRGEPFETGVVRGIHVRDGQGVKAGSTRSAISESISGTQTRQHHQAARPARLSIAGLSVSQRTTSAGQIDRLSLAVADILLSLRANQSRHSLQGLDDVNRLFADVIRVHRDRGSECSRHLRGNDYGMQRRRRVIQIS
jgi:multidrug efflux pump subunit AcrA (membrane-fusion protein)